MAKIPPRPLTGWRLWSVRLALAALPPLLFFAVIEGALRLGGSGYPTAFFVQNADGPGFVTNRSFGRQFSPAGLDAQPWPALLAAPKPAGTLRIFVLGESAAMGTPDPSFGFAHLLEVLLRQQFPARKFEVVNAAMRGINSHVILPIARDCAAHQPDLFLLYMGLYAPEPGAVNVAQHLGLVRTIQTVQRTRLAQAIRAGLVRVGKKPPEETQDMAFYRRKRLAADDPRRAPV